MNQCKMCGLDCMSDGVLEGVWANPAGFSLGGFLGMRNNQQNRYHSPTWVGKATLILTGKREYTTALCAYSALVRFEIKKSSY